MTLAAFSTAALVFAFAGTAGAQAQFATNSAANAWTPSVGSGSGSSGFNVNLYQYDDGVSENSLGLTNCGPPNLAKMCWIQRYDAVGGSDTITNVQTAWGTLAFPGGSPPAGTPANVAVWSDPNQDGNPSDGVLLANVVTAIANPDTDIIQIVAIPPTPVSGKFFVGAFCDSACGVPAASKFPAPMDTTQASLTRAWVCASNPASTFNPNVLTANTLPPADMDLVGTPGQFSSVWLLRAEGSGSAPVVYCVAKVNALGCTPAIGFSGSPVAANTSGFNVNGANVRNNKAGILFYGTNTGQSSVPFTGGTLCVKTPIRRTQALFSGGSPAPANDCSGVYTIDMNAFAHQAGPPVPPAILLVPGTQMNVQFWGRDPGFPAPNNTTLTDALEYTIG